MIEDEAGGLPSARLRASPAAPFDRLLFPQNKELLKAAFASLPRLRPRPITGGEVEVPAYARKLELAADAGAQPDEVGPGLPPRPIVAPGGDDLVEGVAALPDASAPFCRAPVPAVRPAGVVGILAWRIRERLDDRGTDDEAARFEPTLLPGRARRRRPWTLISFCCCVVLPALLAAVYFYAIASDQFIAEFRFSVLQSTPVLPGQPAPALPTMGGSGLASGLSALVGGSSPSSLTGASTQNFLVVDYLKSREAIRQIAKVRDIEAMYSRHTIDRWSRYAARPGGDFLPYWQSMVDASFDQVTGLARVEVRAFTPQDALNVANDLVSMSESLINTIVNRSNIDAVRFAEGEVKRAQDRLKEERARLAAFRAREGVIDPTTSIVPANVTQLNGLETSMISLKTQLNTYYEQGMSNDSPSVRNVKAQITALNGEITRVRNEVAVKRGGTGVLADVMARYEKLNLDIQFDQSMVVSTQQALDQARANAAAQHLYMTPYVEPQLVTGAAYPKRLQSSFLAALLLFAIWLGGFLVVRAVQEHAA